jgi:hypothetical protein
MDPLHATIEEFAADGYTHVQCYWRQPGAFAFAHHSARMSRNRSAASRRDIFRRDRSNRTCAHTNAATLSLTSTADSIRPVAACLTSH